MSDDAGVRKIMPVWAKNLENARRVAKGLAAERLRRVGELSGRDQVAAQHEMLTGAFVAIVHGCRSGALGELSDGLEVPTVRPLEVLAAVGAKRNDLDVGRVLVRRSSSKRSSRADDRSIVGKLRAAR